MKKINGKLIFSPSDLINFMESPFITWMDRYNLEFPNEVKSDDTDESLKILQKKGIEHEGVFFNKLKEEGKDILEIAQDDNSFAVTQLGISEGREIIYQANLFSNDNAGDMQFAGYADFLFKVEGNSKLGNWHYEPWDTKLALKPKPYFIIQLCCYAEMLESIQGYLPKKIHIVLGSGDTKSFNTEDYFDYYKQLKKSFIKQQLNFNPQQQPELIGLEGHGRWSEYAEKILKEQDHLSLVANIKKVQIKKLQKNGIKTLTQLAQTTLDKIPKMNSDVFESLKRQALMQLQSVGKSKPDYEIIRAPEDNPKKGLALLPPASPNDVWFDMEGYPLVKGGLEYLFGVTYLDNDGKLLFKDWWAHDAQQEKQAFCDFVNWIHERWKNDPTMHIYHYAPYEKTALKRLMGVYGICEDQVDDFLRGNVLIDLYKIVREGLKIGEPKYSLKNIEHLYKNKRNTNVAKATDSIVYYERWLECKDGNDWQNSEILKSIRDYNEEDCLSTKLLCDWLREVQTQEKISYIDKLEKPVEDPKEIKVDDITFLTSQLAKKLIHKIEIEPNLTNEQKKLKELFANLLEFHRREDKPMWWAMFDRHEMTEEELIEDVNCLGGLVRTNSPVQLVKRSFLHEYSFEPTQDTKMKSDIKCYYAHDLDTKVDITHINNKQGLVSIKIGPSQSQPPERLSLIPDEFIPATTIQKSIFSTVKEWDDANKLSQAITDFLLRRRPCIDGNIEGSIIKGVKSLKEEAIDVIKNMNNTTLCIQGPPGSGKTYIASHAIVELIRNGKTVGVTSNSHKAIDNVIDKVMAVADEQNINFHTVKIKKKKENVENKKIHIVDTASKVFPNTKFKLISGTAWTFSNELAKNQLDYLFVDEAGQVSIANLIGMAASTKNIVLMGDQMQLSQPTKGSHPGESGQSCLNYLLQEHQTIPNNLGIFLDKTFRLHPNICSFISNAIYEGRLLPEAVTSQRQIIVPLQDNNLITKDSGILFVPVEHEDNSQASEEEVEAIEKLINDLLKCKFKDKDNNIRPLTMDDILIVAPYNMQVLKIQEAIPQAKVGSVDKFQGQEAAVVIISMCASNAADSVRGLEFLLNKNRINVAISRAQVLAIVVGNPNLANTPCNTVEQMELVNLFCKILEQGQIKTPILTKRIGRSKITRNNKLTKRLNGLIRIDADLLFIDNIVQEIIEKEKTLPHTHFTDFQAICIIYRKCFTSDKRGAQLTEKHLLNTTIEQKNLDKWLKELADTHVAHCDKEEYDKAFAYLIIDNNSGLAIDVDISQDLYEPLSCNDFQELLILINTIRSNVLINIQELRQAIIEEYNNSLKDQATSSVQKI